MTVACYVTTVSASSGKGDFGAMVGTCLTLNTPLLPVEITHRNQLVPQTVKRITNFLGLSVAPTANGTPILTAQQADAVGRECDWRRRESV